MYLRVRCTDQKTMTVAKRRVVSQPFQMHAMCFCAKQLLATWVFKVEEDYPVVKVPVSRPVLKFMLLTVKFPQY